MQTVSSNLIPKVAVGMPVYNGERYLAQAIESIISQTFVDFELIISDNASTDGTEEICKRYQKRDRRISYIRQSRNLGAGNNFISVLERANSKYFMWAACDDEWEASWLERLTHALEDRSNNSFAFGEMQCQGENGEPFWHLGNGRMFPFHSKYRSMRLFRHFLLPEASGKANLFYGLYSTSELKKLLVNGFQGHMYADVIFVHKALNNLRLTQIPGTRFYKRVHDTNVGRRIFPDRSNLDRLWRVGIEVFIVLPIRYIKETPGRIMQTVMVFSMPLKWAAFIYFALLRRLRQSRNASLVRAR